MSCLINGYTIKQEEVVGTVASVDIKTREEFGAGCHARKALDRLYKVGGAHEGESFVDVTRIYSFQAGRRTPFHIAGVGCDTGFFKSVDLGFYENGIS